MRMQRRRISHKDVPRFLGELKDEGATRVRCGPVALDGSVEVRWMPAEIDVARHAADLEAWRLPFLLSGVIFALMLVVLLVAVL